ncbi:phosphotransferase family protein [Geomicrobium sediminis]|uniref:Hygromycin-B 4-O-kinase n=1 Tax=Geomicrobium sediminis TaxID=1347788 RepID=A0ABS2PHG2_9BACL|nr:aminoglycoside phosphotransferase family protein [Geomicrobium sediminis]MBM7634880.1 hygromycin-B 4-O-kinase [Geomicrobium sediminis]
MKSFKKDVSDQWVNAMVKEHYPDAEQFKRIDIGELSRVDQFMTKEKVYVAHIREHSESFYKARDVYNRYGTRLPIPRVIAIHDHQGTYMMVSEKLNGDPVSAYPQPTQADLASHLITILESMITVRDNDTFGWMNRGDNKRYQTWQDMLEGFFIEESEGFFANWRTMFTTGVLDKEVFDAGYDKMLELASYAPKRPFLVHGDFHLGNVVTDGTVITGIVDWEMAMYGDFLYDVANLHLWSPNLDFPAKVKRYFEEEGVEIPYFNERLQANLLCRLLNGLRFYAKQENRDGYHLMKNTLMKQLDEV